MAGEGKSGVLGASGRCVLPLTMQRIGTDRQSLGSVSMRRLMLPLLAMGLIAVRSAPAQSPATLDSATLRRVLAAERVPVESVGEIHRTSRHILIDTHINPSAGTIIVLTRELNRVTTLEGWVLRILPDDVVLYHRNNVHFAPTHWVELWTWDPATGRDSRLYPSVSQDSVRRAYVDTVRSIYRRAGEPWLRANNHHGVAERFDSRLGDTIVVAPSGRTVAFVVTFGGGDGTPAATPPLEVAVVCRDIVTRGSRCTERPASALANAHPGWTRLQILDDLVGSEPRGQ